ncbi:MAG: hypothetical protein ACM3PY_20110 [Omnitrophica WOR_2 bacterium]
MNNSGVGSQNLSSSFTKFRLQRGLVFGALIVTALFAFEIFNFSTTDYALGDLLGNLKFAGVKWATILAIAFCGIDFAGIARLFTPQEGAEEPNEVWYLFGAWMLAATMNAMLTWWGVSLAIVSHQTLGNAVIERQTLLHIVPIFVAVMVWLIRVLIIGTFSVAGERLFSQTSTRAVKSSAYNRPAVSRTTGISRPGRDISTPSRPVTTPVPAPSFRPAPKKDGGSDPSFNRPEPSYHPVAMSPRSNNQGDQQSFR